MPRWLLVESCDSHHLPHKFIPCGGVPEKEHKFARSTDKHNDNNNNEEEMMPLVLNLQMNIASHGEEQRIPNYEEALDSLETMIKQDCSDAYSCRDYLGRRAKASAASPDSSLNPEDMIDDACREKMVEWCYKGSDHFGISREICAFTFSLLDRFIDKCSCDRTAFKLAAMTSLYIATKMFNGKQLSVASLAELSRGEFLAEHISQMERIILDALDYRVNPPIIQAFIQQLRPLYPIMDGYSADEVYNRATFYSELCVFDYTFVSECNYALAVACLLNAFQDVEGHYIAQQLTKDFIVNLNEGLGSELSPESLEKSQARLWYLYSCSTQSQFDEVQPAHSFHEQTINKYDEEASQEFAYSPVSIVPKNKVRYNNTMPFSSL